jgi:transposase InsO family protein
VTPNAVWLADITYIDTDEGWLYLAGVKDMATREIVGPLSVNVPFTCRSMGRWRTTCAQSFAARP